MFGHSFSAINSFMDSTMCRKVVACLNYIPIPTVRTIIDVCFHIRKRPVVPDYGSQSFLYSWGTSKTYEYGEFYGGCYSHDSLFTTYNVIQKSTYYWEDNRGIFPVSPEDLNYRMLNQPFEKKEKLKRPKLKYYVHESLSNPSDPMPGYQETEKFDIPEKMMNKIEEHFEEIKKEEREQSDISIKNIRNGCLSLSIFDEITEHSGSCCFFCQKGENKIDGTVRLGQTTFHDTTIIDHFPSTISPPNKINVYTYHRPVYAPHIYGPISNIYRYEITEPPVRINGPSKFGRWVYTKVGTAPPCYVFPPDEIIPLQ